jgi:hypothetical protein
MLDRQVISRLIVVEILIGCLIVAVVCRLTRGSRS